MQVRTVKVSLTAAEDVRHELAVRSHPDRAQHQHGVDERGYERAQRQLGAAVADEVAQHPRPELVRGQRQGEQDDGEDQADHGDEGGGDGGEDLPGRVRAAADHPAGPGEVTVVGASVHGLRACEQHDRGHDLQGGHERQAGTEHLPAPV
jgi:hypothetical protein